MSINSKFYSEDIKTIEKIKFSIWSNDEIKKYSAVSKDPFGINLPDSYDAYEPKKGGLVDLRLGTCDPYLNCTTCGLDYLECPGHFGHTDLAEHVFHWGFLIHIVNILKCTCLKCSNILIEKNDDILKQFINKNGKTRYKIIKELTKNINYCYNCGTSVPKIKKEVKESSASVRILLEKEVGNILTDDKTGIKTEEVKILKEYLTPRFCYNILRNISEIDCFLLGFDATEVRPEHMIIHCFPIPPVSIRPTSKIDFMAASTMEDSLTLKIADIINANIRVRQQMNKENNNNLYDVTTLLQYHIATYFDNDSASLPKTEFRSGGKLTKSISDRLKAKEGRMRSNLMGKRVDFSARSVITSDPNINIDEVGVPLVVAKDLTIPEEVTPRNINKLTKLVLNGRDKYPGANYVHKIIIINGKPINQRIDLKYRKNNITLSYGDIVERHIVNGDYVLFNRQPTLHKPSMMGHKIHVLERDNINTFRLNVNVCNPYNADFDGDEMNLHLAQSIQARTELARIANVKYQIIGAKDSNPIIGCQQDSLYGAFVLSDDIEIDYSLAANLLCCTTSESKNKLIKNKSIKGSELFSHIIPKGINSTKRNEGNITFQIKDGNLTKGLLNKAQLGTKKNSIVHYVWDKYGPTATQQFIDNTQRLTLNYLMNRGFSVGFKDVLIDDKLIKLNNEIIHNKILAIKHQITQFENEKDYISPSVIEFTIRADLSTILPNIGKNIFNSLPNDNALKILVSSGGKGNPVNIGQIAGCQGQISLGGERIKKSVENRTLPLFHYHDDTPMARGFITSNLVDGYKGHEFFFSTMTGREGLISTAIKTAQTGYIQRKLIKSLEDLHVHYDGTVRTANNVVVQYLYGESGIDTIKQTEQKIKLIEMSNIDIKNKLVFSIEELNKLNKVFSKKYKSMNDDIYNKFIDFRDNLRDIYYNTTYNYKILEDSFLLPINFYRLTQEYTSNSDKIDLDPNYIIEKLEDMINNYDNRLLVLMNKNIKILNEDENMYKIILKIALYEYICPKKCIFEYNLTKDKFDQLMNDIIMSFSRSNVDPGEMVGIIAAQSLGEPTTQMSLDEKHTSGVISKVKVTTGLSRVEELFGYSKKIKTPQMTIYFDKKYNTNAKDVNKIGSYFKHLTIGELMESTQIFYNTNGTDELSKLLKDDNTTNPFFINNNKVDINNLPFVFRFKLNIGTLMDKETTLLDIKTKFITYWYNNFTTLKNMKRNLKDVISTIDKLAILSNNNNIIHIRFKMNNFNYSLLTRFMKIVLNTVTLKGIDNINDIYINKQLYVTFKEDGSKNVGNEYNILTSGINLIDLKFLKGIDNRRTIINDVQTAYMFYGIEAAKSIIINEIIFTFNSAGFINNAHISLLVDFMTHTGNITSITRHGLNKLDIDPLTRASFEKTVDHFTTAAIFNEEDTLKSISSKVTIGRVVHGGTGAFELLLDTEKIRDTEYIIDEASGRTSFTNIKKESIFEDIIKYGTSELDFVVPT
uniref:DNA-directed RNA polymerase n=1 Tax=viral metagenome TaxID=1070528 RepID=A0A6C0J664_9ZZZZ